MRQLFANGYEVRDELLKTLVYAGIWPTPETKILDFGCGAGGLVYALRDAGFDAYGFDIHERVDYRDRADRRFFGFMQNATADTSNTVVEAGKFYIPFEDDSFDIVVSTSVIEHVLDLSSVMAEIARVVKPSGFSVHIYPKKSIVVEPHIYVPFGSRWQSWPYFYFWGLLGVRNEYQQHMSARQVADNNLLYSRTGLKYHRPRDLHRICEQFFDEVKDAERFLYKRAGPRRLLRSLKESFRDEMPFRAFALTQRLGVLWTEKKKPRASRGPDPTAGQEPAARKLTAAA